MLEADIPSLDPPAIVMEMQTVGSASYRFGPFKIYDAELKTPDGEFSWQAPFSLALTYSRSFSAEKLANASLSEMSRISGQHRSKFNPLYDRLHDCFANVRKGDVIEAVSLNEDEARFSYNGEVRCELDWPGFRSAFFGIWLSDQARYSDEAGRLIGRP